MYRGWVESVKPPVSQKRRASGLRAGTGSLPYIYKRHATSIANGHRYIEWWNFYPYCRYKTGSGWTQATNQCRWLQDCLGAFYGHKLVGSPGLNVIHAQRPATAILHLYGPKTFKNSAGPCTGPGEALECTYWLYKPGQTSYSPCTCPGRLHRGLLGAQNRRKLCMLSFQPRLYCALTDPQVFEKSGGPARHALWLPTGSHGLGLLTVREFYVT